MPLRKIRLPRKGHDKLGKGHGRTSRGGTRIVRIGENLRHMEGRGRWDARRDRPGDSASVNRAVLLLTQKLGELQLKSEPRPETEPPGVRPAPDPSERVA